MRNILLVALLFIGVSAFGQEWAPSISLPDEAPRRHHPVTFTLNGY